MYKKQIYRILALLMLANASGCRTADPVPAPEAEPEREPASLVMTTDIHALITPEGTRTYDADDNTIRHAALFLIDYLENRLVAYRIIYPGVSDLYNDTDAENGFVDETTGLVDPSLTSGKSVRVTFNYNDPKHGAAEKLTRGSYMLLAVANFSESDQFGDSGIATQIRNLVDRFRESPDTGITEFRETCESFYNLKLKIPEKTVFPYIRPGDVSIPLSSTHVLNLISGENRATTELKHTCARVRVELRNYSDVPLTINDLSFSNNFTQSICYLFSRADGENYGIENDYYKKGAPVVTDNDNAITPFTPGQILTKEMGTTTLFDGLIYESRDLTNNYTYTIDVSYEGLGDLNNYILKNNGQAVTTPDGVAAQGPYFLIRRSDAFSYLYVENDKVYASTGSYTPQEILDLCKRQNYYYNYVWELVPAGSSYRLRNVQTGDYIENVRYNDMESEYYRLGTTLESGADSFTLETNNGFLLFRSDYYSNRHWFSDAYINTRGTDNTLVVGWNGNGEWSQFALYPLDQHTSLSSYNEVVLRTIDKTSGIVNDVHEIERNDYIRILIEVSYNPDKGDFDFVVNDWEIGGGDITFN